MTFEYFYGEEANKFSFYRIPRELVKDEQFRTLSSDAKLLYGLLFDRMGISAKNCWRDDKNKVYIYYPLKEIQEDLNCGHDKATKLLNELDTNKGIGLIERVKQGLGKPDRIYVRRFYTETVKKAEKAPDSKESDSKEDSSSKEKEENGDDDKEENRRQECGKEEIRDAELPNCGFHESRSQECLIPEANYINPIQTEHIYTYSSYTNPSISQEKFEETMDEVKEQVDYDFLLIQHPDEDVKGLTEIICEVLCSNQPDILIGRERLPMGKVQSRFRDLESKHLDYVLECLSRCTSKIRNIKGYIITSLYNAPLTIGMYYENLVNHDMYGAYGEKRRYGGY